METVSWQTLQHGGSELILKSVSPIAPSDEPGSQPTSDKASNPDEWAEFVSQRSRYAWLVDCGAHFVDLMPQLHRPGEKFFDFNKVREEIVADTEAKTGKNAGEYEILEKTDEKG